MLINMDNNISHIGMLEHLIMIDNASLEMIQTETTRSNCTIIIKMTARVSNLSSMRLIARTDTEPCDVSKVVGRHYQLTSLVVSGLPTRRIS